MQITSDLLNRAGQTSSTAGPHLNEIDGTSPAPFSGLLHQAMQHLDQLNDDASRSLKGVLSGDGTDLHSAFIATQKAGLAFDAAMAVRNKAVGAFQQIMGMQF